MDIDYLLRRMLLPREIDFSPRDVNQRLLEVIYYCHAKDKHILIPEEKEFLNWDREKEFRRYYNYMHPCPNDGIKQEFTGKYGHHLPKDKVITGELKDFPFPYQIFLSSPQSKKTISRKDLIGIRDNRSPSPLFVHAKYIYNLCNEDTWLISAVQEELKAAKFIRAKGVVIHCGKRKQLAFDQAVEIMYRNIQEITSISTVPLILETCAKQGTEILGDLEDLVDFYKRLDKNKVKLCVDSCHVFSSGYDPLQFLTRLEQEFPSSVTLVHFNDSKKERGCHVDRHEIPGLGCIGYTRMKELYSYCISKNIPLVYE